MDGRLMLLDSASLYFRSYFGVPDRFHGPDGTPVNAVRGFIDTIARLVQEFEPDLLIACWDEDWRPAFRTELLPSYKAHRVAEGVADGSEEIPHDLARQEPIMILVLEAFGIARRGAAGFEADDVIAALSRRHDGPVDVVSGDRDLFQLVDDARRVRVLYTARGLNRLALVTDQWLEQKYAVPGNRYADMAILRGDASDGLPGLPGVGEKTAASLVQRFGDVSDIRSAAADASTSMSPSVRRAVGDAADYLTRADPVVRLVHPVPVELGDCAIPPTPADPAAVVALADAYGLDAPVNRLLAALAARRNESR